MKPFAWGIIGAGSIAEAFIADLPFVQVADCFVPAILGRQRDSTEAFAARHQIPFVFTDTASFLEGANLDAVYIATPHVSHFDFAIECLQHGIPVLCEKPLTINAVQTGKLIDAARSNRTFLMEGMWTRFLPSIYTVLSLLHSGSIGRIISIKASLTYRAPRGGNNRYFDPEQAGGSLLDLGIYTVYLAQLLLGKPDHIKAAASITDKGVDEFCAFLFSYDGGAYASLESSIISRTVNEAIIVGEKGRLIVHEPWNEKPARISIVRENALPLDRPCDWMGTGFYYEVEEVIKCLDKGSLESELMSHSASLMLAKTMDDIRKQIHLVYPVEHE